MSECAHGNGPFADLTKPERTIVATRMIEIIKERAVQGIAITIDNLEFYKAAAAYPKLRGIYKTPYTFVSHTMLAGVASWLEANSHVGSMAYFFEAGHRSQNQTDQIMRRVFTNRPGKLLSYRYAGHAFVPKEKSPAVQAADLLAWQWYKDRKNKSEGRPQRKDCASLLQLHHTALHLDRAGIDAIFDEAAQIPDGFRPAVVVSRAQAS